jgi:hypothetical protein
MATPQKDNPAALLHTFYKKERKGAYRKLHHLPEWYTDSNF